MDTLTIFVICYGSVWAFYILARLFFLFLWRNPWFFYELFENVRRFFINILCRCLPGSISTKLSDRFLNEHEEFFADDDIEILAVIREWRDSLEEFYPEAHTGLDNFH